MKKFIERQKPGDLVVASNIEQKATYFGMEYDNQGKNANPDELSDDGAEEFHAQRTNHHPYQVDQKKTYDDVKGNCSPYQPVDLIEQRGNQKDVHNIKKPDSDKREH